jgi:hypothetical protein
MDERGSKVSRRRLLLGVGAAGGAAALGAAAPASAQPATPAGHAQADTPPAGLAPISSAPVFGVSYQFRSWLEFTAEDDILLGRKFGGEGVYTSAGSDFLATSFDLPAGATLYDLEWYVSNSAAMSVFADIWQSSAGGFSTFWSASIPAGVGVTATRFAIPTNVNGPYPHGTRLAVACASPMAGSNQINGVRVGFTHAPRTPVLLTTPVRAYDSRTTGGPLTAGHSRAISLASAIPVGAAGAIVNLTVTQTVTSGYLTIYAAGTPVPTTSSINWFGTNQTLSNQATTAVSLTRSVTVTAGGHSTQFIIDVLGYLV